MDQNIEDVIAALPACIETAIHKTGAIGVILGVLICREFLTKTEPEIAELLNRDTMKILLTRVARGDLILQDQVMTGNPYDPEADKIFRQIATEYLKSSHEQRS